MATPAAHPHTTTTQVPATMRAMVRREYGAADVIHAETPPVPTPVRGEVLVRVRAAGLDRGSWHLMTGLPHLVRPIYGLRRPRKPLFGLDLAGTVVAVGERVTRFAVGDEVMGMSRGTFAEYVVAPERKLVARPASLTPELASVVPVSGITALQGLTDAGRLREGRRVLITGASGGVGTFAVQIAAALGAEVTGVCSAAKADLVRALGAAHVVDYAVRDVTRGPERYDLILDMAGNAPLHRLRRILEPRGTLVVAGGEHGGRWTGGNGRQLRALLLSPFTRRRLTALAAAEDAGRLGRLVEMIEAGQVTPALDGVYALDDLPEAMRRLESGAVRGKVAIRVP